MSNLVRLGTLYVFVDTDEIESALSMWLPVLLREALRKKAVLLQTFSIWPGKVCKSIFFLSQY